MLYSVRVQCAKRLDPELIIIKSGDELSSLLLDWYGEMRPEERDGEGGNERGLICPV